MCNAFFKIKKKIGNGNIIHFQSNFTERWKCLRIQFNSQRCVYVHYHFHTPQTMTPLKSRLIYETMGIASDAITLTVKDNQQHRCHYNPLPSILCLRIPRGLELRPSTTPPLKHHVLFFGFTALRPISDLFSTVFPSDRVEFFFSLYRRKWLFFI